MVSTTIVSPSQPDRISHPGRLHVGRRERTAVGEHLAVNGARFVEEQQQVRRVDDLQSIGNVQLLRNARRQAADTRVVLAVVLDPFLVERFRPRLQRDVFRLEIRREIQQMTHDIRRHPEPGQIDVAVGHPSRRRLQIDRAVGGPRHVLPRIGRPLRVRAVSDAENDRHQRRVDHHGQEPAHLHLAIGWRGL
jgi:hypothetical protein